TRGSDLVVSSAATRARPRSAASRYTSPGTSAAGAQADARGRGRLRPSLLNQAPARKRSSPPGADTQALLLLPSTHLSRLKIGQLDLVRASEVQGQTSFSARHAGEHFLPFRPLGGGQNRIAMDDRPGQNPHFAGAATAGAAPERHLDAGVLQTVQQMLGRADLDRLARAFAAQGLDTADRSPGTQLGQEPVALHGEVGVAKVQER